MEDTPSVTSLSRNAIIVLVATGLAVLVAVALLVRHEAGAGSTQASSDTSSCQLKKLIKDKAYTSCGIFSPGQSKGLEEGKNYSFTVTNGTITAYHETAKRKH